MVLNQNETKSEQPKVSGEGHASRPKLSTTPGTSAFTLTELLVVIAIIAVLAALATNAAINALNAGKRTAITLELQQLATAVEQFKADFGAYPPNGMQNSTYLGFAPNDFTRMFNKAFPRHNEPGSLIAGLAGAGTSSLQFDADNRGMNGAEALVFWLGGFSKDSQFPISGPGGPSYDKTLGITGESLEERNRLYGFDLGRLGPRDSAGQFSGRFIAYEVDLNRDGDTNDFGEQRQINLWFYTPSGSEQPIAYFDASRHRAQVETSPGTFVNNYDPYFGQLSPTFMDSFFAIKRPNQTNPVRIEFANQGKFQILHAGLDDIWGNMTVMHIGAQGDPASNVLLYPEGPFIGDIADTLTNFTTGTLEDAQE